MWCLTIFAVKIAEWKIVKMIDKLKEKCRYILHGTCMETSCSKFDSGKHYHLFLHFNRPVQRSFFSTISKELLFQAWVRMLQKWDFPTLNDAARAYIKYIKRKENVREYDHCRSDLLHSPKSKSRPKTELIAEQIKKGVKCRQLMEQYPALIQKIKQMAVLRPPRAHVTKVFRLYGPPGSGKSYYVATALAVLKDHHPLLDHYFKIGGFSKYWEGYDN